MEKISIKVTDLLLEKKYIELPMYSIYQYGLQMALEVSCSFVVSIIICLIFGMLIEGIIFFAIFIPLRSFVGGFHMKRYYACFWCSCLSQVGILILVKYVRLNLLSTWMILIISLAIILIIAKKELVGEEKGFYYITISVLCCIIFGGWVSYMVRNSSILFLIACTVALVAISKILEKIELTRKNRK